MLFRTVHVGFAVTGTKSETSPNPSDSPTNYHPFSSGRVTSLSQRPLPDTTQHSLEIHATGGIRTHILSRRVALELRLGPCGYWDRRASCEVKLILLAFQRRWYTL